jgi:hypothetical protein
VGFRRCGEIHWTDDTATGQVLARQVEAAARRGDPIRLIDEAELCGLLPGRAPRAGDRSLLGMGGRLRGTGGRPAGQPCDP